MEVENQESETAEKKDTQETTNLESTEKEQKVEIIKTENIEILKLNEIKVEKNENQEAEIDKTKYGEVENFFSEEKTKIPESGNDSKMEINSEVDPEINEEKIKEAESSSLMNTENDVTKTKKNVDAHVNKVFLYEEGAKPLNFVKTADEDKKQESCEEPVGEDTNKVTSFYAGVATMLIFDSTEELTSKTENNPLLSNCCSEKVAIKRKKGSQIANKSLSLISDYGPDDDDDDDDDSEGKDKKMEEENKDDSVDDINLNRAASLSFTKPQSSPSSNSSSDSSSSDEENTPSEIDYSEGEEFTPPPPPPAKKAPRFNKDPLELDKLPPVENLQISVKEEECMPVGKIFSIVDRLLVIESFTETPALLFDTIIFNQIGQPIGKIYDIFGHIKRPFYSIRFNKNEDIVAAGLEVNNVVYCAPKTEHTKYIFTNQLLKEKGSDASWVNNEEPPTHCLDYSDDEKEREAKRSLNQDKGKDEEEVLVKAEPGDSPARKRYLSFEEQMNRNNTMRTRAFKRAASTTEKPWDGGWHNYKRSPGNPVQNDRSREYPFVRGAVFRPPVSGNTQWLQQQFSQPQPGVQQQRPRPQPLFQFGGSTQAPFQQQPPPQPFAQSFPRTNFRPPGFQSNPCPLGPPTQGFQTRQPSPSYHTQNIPQNFQPNTSLSPQQNFQPGPGPNQGFPPLNQNLNQPPPPINQQGFPQTPASPQQQGYKPVTHGPPPSSQKSQQGFHSVHRSPPPPQQNYQPINSGNPAMTQTGFHANTSISPPCSQQFSNQQPVLQCRGFQSNHRPPPSSNQGRPAKQCYQPRIPFNPGFVSSPPPMQFRQNAPSFVRTTTTPPTFSQYQTNSRPVFPTVSPSAQFHFMGNSPPFRASPPNFRNRPPPH